MGVIDITQSETQIVFTRHYHAPKDIVFTAFSRAEHLQQWWGAEGWHMSECSVDFRPGGEWLYALKNKEGEEHWAKAVY